MIFLLRVASAILFSSSIALAWVLPIANSTSPGGTRAREQIYDTAHSYHSGYWPIYGDSESQPANPNQRPGGNIRIILVFTINPWRHTSDRYRLVGDQYSVDAVRRALRAECLVGRHSSIVFDYNPASDDPFHALPHIQSVIQFYRASTFALSLDGYNSSAIATGPESADSAGQDVAIRQPPTHLPGDTDNSLLRCINGTVGTSLPLFSPESVDISMTRYDVTKNTLPLEPLIMTSMALFILLLNWLFPASKDITDPWLGRLGHLAAVAALFG